MQYINQTMGIYDCSSMFQPSPSSQTPLVIHHNNHHNTFNHVIPSPPSHGGLLKRVVDGLQFAYEDGSTTTRFHAVPHEPDPSRFETETGKMNAQAMVDAKVVAASKSHSEAERRRRERINNHLSKLRSLLPNTTKTDKASLLAEVIQHVKQLKHQTNIIAEQSSVPGEIDELIIDNTSDEEGQIVIRASLCCDDRSGLLKDLITTLKMLRLRTLKAEITTLGRRVKNVLFVTSEDHHSSTHDDQQMVNHWINAIEEKFKSLIEKPDDGDDSSFIRNKRQRTNDIDIFKYHM